MRHLALQLGDEPLNGRRRNVCTRQRPVRIESVTKFRARRRLVLLPRRPPRAELVSGTRRDPLAGPHLYTSGEAPPARQSVARALPAAHARSWTCAQLLPPPPTASFRLRRRTANKLRLLWRLCCARDSSHYQSARRRVLPRRLELAQRQSNEPPDARVGRLAANCAAPPQPPPPPNKCANDALRLAPS